MGFLLGAFGKMAAGRRVRDLQARMMRVQSKLRRATRQIETTSKMLETQKKMELNSLTMMSNMATASMPSVLANGLGIDQNTLAMFTGMGAGLNGTSNLSEDEKAAIQKQYGEYQMGMTQMKANNEMYIAQMKNQIEEKYEQLNDVLLEPIKMEEDSLQSEKDSLESQIQIADADYKACQEMEKSSAKNLAPQYTAGG